MIIAWSAGLSHVSVNAKMSISLSTIYSDKVDALLSLRTDRILRRETFTRWWGVLLVGTRTRLSTFLPFPLWVLFDEQTFLVSEVTSAAEQMSG